MQQLIFFLTLKNKHMFFIKIIIKEKFFHNDIFKKKLKAAGYILLKILDWVLGLLIRCQVCSPLCFHWSSSSTRWVPLD